VVYKVHILTTLKKYTRLNLQLARVVSQQSKRPSTGRQARDMQLRCCQKGK
jgi:hypothetical protein